VNNPDSLLLAAADVVGILKQHCVDAVVIGAVALAAHNYVRHTEDIDLGVNADLPTMRAVLKSLHHAGFLAELHEPAGDDPLGGVIDITSPFGVLQIVSFANRFPAVIDDALRGPNLATQEGGTLRIAPIPQLIALKLYAGGHKSNADIVELLVRNSDLDLEVVRAACKQYRLKGLEKLIADAEEQEMDRSAKDTQLMAIGPVKLPSRK